MTTFIACYKKHLEITGNRCAAELLNLFKNYKPNHKTGWLIITITELKEKLLDTWGRDSIRKACKLLDDLGLIKRDHPRLNKRAWMYKFVTDELSENSTTVVDNPTTVADEPTTTYIKDPILDPSQEQQEREKTKSKKTEPIQTNSTPLKKLTSPSSDYQKISTRSIVREQRESLPKENNSTPQWNWIPEGPWKIDGKLDTELVDWQAKRWLAKGWGIDIHEARKKIRAYYKNDPTRLSNDWQEYQEYTAHKLANIVVREKNGIAIAPYEKEELAPRLSKVFQSNPHSYSLSNIGEVEKYKQWIDSELIGTAIDWDGVAELVDDWEQSQIEQACEIPQGADNPQAYSSLIREEDRDWAYQQYLKAVNQSKNDE
jgi:hypothetical protein